MRRCWIYQRVDDGCVRSWACSCCRNRSPPPGG